MKKLLLLSATLILLSACDEGVAPDGERATVAPATSGTQAPQVQTVIVPQPAETTAPVPGGARVVGKWTGPEGTYMIVNPGEVKIRDLDEERTFKATVTDTEITFTRDGKKEIVKPGDGNATGMKWLTDKKDCLVVKPGEGYCRG